MDDSTIIQTSTSASAGPNKATLSTLIGSGDRIGRLVLPFLVTGVTLNMLRPAVFAVGGPSAALRLVSQVVLGVGVVVWAWSVALILAKVLRRELITTGPFALVKHPLYTGVALLVMPWLGFLFNTWIGVSLGAVMYLASRRYAPEEERALSEKFGVRWDQYAESVKISWL